MYELIKKELGTDDIFNHQGFNLYEESIKIRRQELGGLRSASDRVFPGYINALLSQLNEEFAEWQKEEPEEYTRCKSVVDAILSNQFDSLDKDQLIKSVKESIHQIPGISLAYEIHAKQEDMNKAINLPPERYSSSTTKRTKTAKERYEEYKKQSGKDS